MEEIKALQACLFILLAVIPSMFAQTWTTNTLSPSAFMLAASADGSDIVAACGDGDVYTSTNEGVNWVQHLGLPNATVVASSADGRVLFARGGYLYASTNGGATWNQLLNAPTYNGLYGVQFITCSADGTKLLVALGVGQYAANFYTSPLFTSADMGITWVSNNVPIARWQCGATSADGSKLVAAIYNGGIYTSTNFGADWVSNSIPHNYWTGVASSVDGSKLVAVANGNGGPSGAIFSSTNSGMLWVSNNAPPIPWSSVASSADGGKLVAAAGGQSFTGPIYSSTNYGANWVSNNAPIAHWATVASSADGNRQFASGYINFPGHIYGSTAASTPPRMKITNVSGSLLMTWPVPSTNFIIQGSTDLVSWANVTNAPTLNFTSLQYQIMLSPSNSSSFYRLVSP